MSVGAAALEAEVRKHRANDPKCSELGWVCVPPAVLWRHIVTGAKKLTPPSPASHPALPPLLPATRVKSWLKYMAG